MKTGKRVKCITDGKIGVSRGPVTRYGVEWILVEWDHGGKAIVLEKYLEILDG